MIKSFGDIETELIWNGTKSKKLPHEIQDIIRRKLRMIHNASDLTDLKIPPANRLQKLKGDLKEYYSIRVNDQWRIVFRWINNDAYEIKVVDYH